MSTEILHPVTTNAADNLKVLFAHAGVTQIQVGAWLGISDAQVSRLLRPEKTRQYWTLPQLGRIADYFGIPPAALLGSTKEMFERLPPREHWRLPAPLEGSPFPGQVNSDRELPRKDSNHQPAGCHPVTAAHWAMFTESYRAVGIQAEKYSRSQRCNKQAA